MVIAELLLERDGFFAGERVHGEIHIRFPQVDRMQSASSFFFSSLFYSAPSINRSDSQEALGTGHDILEYAALQLHGHEAHDPRLIRSACEEEDDNGESIQQELNFDNAGDDHSNSSGNDNNNGNGNSKGPQLVHRASDEQIVLRRTHSGSAMMVDNNSKTISNATGMNNTGGSTHHGIRGAGSTGVVASSSATNLSVVMPDMKSFSGAFGACLFTSPIHIFAKSIKVIPGTERRYQFSIRLPPILPPSYRGTSVRYWYLITVAIKLQSSQNITHFSFPVTVLGLGEDYQNISDIDTQPSSSLSASSTNASSSSPYSSTSASPTQHPSETPFVSLSNRASNGGDGIVPALGSAPPKISRRVPHPIESENVTRAMKFPRSYPNHQYDPRSRETTGDSRVRLATANEGVHNSITSVNPFEKETLAANLRRARGPGRALTVVDPNLGGLRLRPRINSDAPSLPRPPVSVNIGTGDNHVAKFTLRKSFVSPGEDFLIAFDFSNAKIRCFKVNVAIETEEKSVAPPPPQAAFVALRQSKSIQGSLSNSSGIAGSSSSSVSAQSQAFEQTDHIYGHSSTSNIRDYYFGESTVGQGPWHRVLATYEFIVSSSSICSMVLTLPNDATPDFATDYIFVHSFLRFEFYVAANTIDAKKRSQDKNESTSKGGNNSSNNNNSNNSSNGFEDQVIGEHDSYVLRWRLPLHVRPWSLLLRERVNSGIGW